MWRGKTMSRLIDANRLKKAFCSHCDGDEPCTEPCIDIGLIETAPTIDAVEVVRCKDCKYKPHLRDAVNEDDAERLKHGYYDGFDLRFPTEGKCPCQILDDEFYSWIPKDDWFCAGGERRDQNNADRT